MIAVIGRMNRISDWLWRRDGGRRLAADRCGSTAVEMAFAAPVVFLFVFGIILSGRALWLQNMLTYSVAEAARCATVNQTTCGSATQIQSYASTQSGNNFDSSIFTVSTPSCGNQVSASYAMTLNILNISLPVTLTADACYPK
jgi:Flp pilus assembly protein TadG